MTQKDMKAITKRVLKSYLSDMEDYHDSQTIDRFDGALNLARLLGLISDQEADKYFKASEEIMY